MPYRTYNNTTYSFNGKEDEPFSGWQDYGFRNYDKKQRRFTYVDPLTAKYPWYTPYQFAGNRVIEAVDLDGLEEKIVITSPFWTNKLIKVMTDKRLSKDQKAGLLAVMYLRAFVDTYKDDYAERTIGLVNNSVCSSHGGDPTQGFQIYGYQWNDPNNHKKGVKLDVFIGFIEPDRPIWEDLIKLHSTQQGVNADGSMKPLQKSLIGLFALAGSLGSLGMTSGIVAAGETLTIAGRLGVVMDIIGAASAIDDIFSLSDGLPEEYQNEFAYLKSRTATFGAGLAVYDYKLPNTNVFKAPSFALKMFNFVMGVANEIIGADDCKKSNKPNMWNSLKESIFGKDKPSKQKE